MQNANYSSQGRNNNEYVHLRKALNLLALESQIPTLTGISSVTLGKLYNLSALMLSSKTWIFLSPTF